MKRLLKILAALLWHIGGFMLIWKSSKLIFEAETIIPQMVWPYLAVLAALLLGGLKAKYLFSHACKRNLARIDQLTSPKLWQFYRAGFFFFLALMIFGGAALSRMAHGSYSFLLTVAVLDLSIATALIGSSYIFWTDKAFIRE
ncbi:MAG: hypothetical protein ABFS03_05770 [Chloroflexota bacterium]